MLARMIAGVVGLALVAGCAGNSSDGPAKSGGGTPASAQRLRDPLLGYTLTLPPGWSAPRVPPGQAVPLAGGGEGCAVGPTGSLPDVSGRRLVSFARGTARRRAANGARVAVRRIRGDNVRGVLVRITRSDLQARSALFASAGGGVAITCRVDTAGASELDRGLSLLLASVRLQRDAALERAQPRVVGGDVEGATLRRSGSRLQARVTLAGSRSAATSLRAVVATLARAFPQTDIAVDATDSRNPRRAAYARFLGGTGAGTIQVPPAAPRRFHLD